MRWCNRKWRINRSQCAKSIITIIILAILGVGFYMDRFNENREKISLELRTKPNEDDRNFNDNLETIISKLDTQSLEKIVKYAVNIPKEISNNESQLYEYDRKCNRLPKASDIVLVNNYWQQSHSSDGFPLYLYSAHYDKRKFLNDNAFIRIFAMLNEQQTNEDYLCNIWYLNNKTIKTISTPVQIHEIKTLSVPLKYNTYMLNCRIPKKNINEKPFAVSITKSDCGKVSNILHVNNQIENDVKDNIGVCLKGMDFAFDDKSIYLVEWLELLKILEVDKVFVYELNIHPNISKVLKHYRNEGFVDIQPLSLPGNQPNTPHEMHEYLYSDMQLKRAHEKLPYNDCLYRNLNYKYIANLDLDEIIIPVKFNTWKDLFINLEKTQKNKKKIPGGYSFRRFINLDKMREQHGYNPNIPKYMYILQNIYHSKEHEGGTKSVLSSELVYTTDNHHPRSCFGDGGTGECFVPTVPTTEAFISHFRSSCKDGRDKFCNVKDSVIDNTVTWKNKKILIKNTVDTLKLLNLV